ncbi:AAA family ATPase, partial [bacterium E08(2017)]
TIHKLELPFFVLATQNPLEQEGTYPLPAAQQDRFIFTIFVDYPELDEENEIVRRVSEQNFGQINEVCAGEELIELQRVLRAIPVADAVIDYANALVRATRLGTDAVSQHATDWLSVGAGPRATINLVTASRCFCALDGRVAPSCDDVARAALPVLRHRLGLNYVARAEGLTTDDVIKKLVADVPKY